MKLTRVVCTALACLGFGLASCNQSAAPTRNPEQTIKDVCKALFDDETAYEYDADYEEYATGVLLTVQEAPTTWPEVYGTLLSGVSYVADFLPAYMNFYVLPVLVDDLVVGCMFTSDDKKVALDIYGEFDEEDETMSTLAVSIFTYKFEEEK